MKREITIVEFVRHCERNADVRFYYANENGNAKTPCVRINLSFPPPRVFVNLRTVCFSDAYGNKMTLTGVRRVLRTRNDTTGLEGFLFECRSASGDADYLFTVLQKNL